MIKSILPNSLRLLGVAAVCGLVGAGQFASAAKAADKKMKVGFAQVGAESAWRTANSASMRGEAEKRGVDLKFVDAQQKQENQIKAIRAFIAQKVDVILLAPVVSAGFEPVLKEAKAAKIPVILTDRSVTVSDPSLYVTFIGSDFTEEGRRVGKWLVEKTGGKGNIVELQGTTGAAPAIERKKGFEEAIAGSPDLKIVMSQTGEFTRAKGKEVMQAFIKSAQGKNEKIDVVFAHNDDMALGAIQALQEAGMKPGTEPLVVSIDGVKGAFEAMVAGTLNATCECNPLIGPIVFDTAEKIVAGQTVDKKLVTHDDFYDQSNAKAALPDRKY